MSTFDISRLDELLASSDTTSSLVQMGQQGSLSMDIFKGVQPENVTTDDVALVSFLIDGSGSMRQHKEEMTIAVNESVSALKQSRAYQRNETGVLMQLAVYNGKLRIPVPFSMLHHINVTQNDVYQDIPECADDCLKDALLQTIVSIRAMQGRYHGDCRSIKVALAIFCDGGTIGDTITTEHVMAELNALRDDLGESRVNIVFVGFGEHAHHTGRDLGFYDVPKAGDPEEKITLLACPSLSSPEGKRMLRKAMALVSYETSYSL
jgi:hypothetical protein